MTRNLLRTVCMVGFCSALAGAVFAQAEPAPQIFQPVKPDQIAVPQAAADPAAPAYVQTLSGNYLSSMFAQRHHDWKSARLYLKDLLAQNPDDPQLLKRAMILAIGSGEVDIGMEFARKVEQTEPDNALSLMFLAADEFHKKNHRAANDYIIRMPRDSLSDFIVPLMQAWSNAGEGKANIAGLGKNILHINHAVLISDHLKQYDGLETLLKNALANPDVTAGDLMIVADIYTHIGEKNKAQKLYKDIQKQYPDETIIEKKLQALESGEKTAALPVIKTASQGMAMALFDMAKLLYQEYSDDSARVFANLALYLDPGLSDADLLLGSITARNNRYEDAIAYYRKITPDDPYFLESRRKAADLLLDAGREDEALAELNILAREHNDTNSLIRIGDVHRQTDQFEKALEFYNDAEAKLGNPVPEEYWYLYYVRGISYERAGQWALAEQDLKTALSYQPNHPYVLNYLGYAWADQGINLKEARQMVEKAAELMPDDGYIIDSLGWIDYKMEKYSEAVSTLERSVQLLPQDPVINDHLGDAYWQTGRKREARFQWQRARNFTKDADMKAALAKKLKSGPVATLKEARSTLTNDETATP